MAENTGTDTAKDDELTDEALDRTGVERATSCCVSRCCARPDSA